MLIFHTLIAPDMENPWDFLLSNSTGRTAYRVIIIQLVAALVFFYTVLYRLEIVKVKMGKVFYELVVVFLDHLYSVGCLL